MLALYQAGRQADALELYQSTRRLLANELGLDPSAELQALERAILNQAPEIEKPTRPRSRVPRTAAGKAAETSRGVFVGRETELDQLTSGLEDVLAGRGRLFLLVGEPGIGKSRLAEEMAARASAAGARVLWGRCWEAGGAPAYWPWVQSLRAYVRDAEPDRAASAARLRRRRARADPARAARDLRRSARAARRSSPRARASACSTPPPSSCGNASDEPADSCSCWTICTPPTRRRCCCSSSSPASSARRGCLLLGAYRDVDPVPGRPLDRACWPRSRASRSPVVCCLRGLSEPDVAEYVELTAVGDRLTGAGRGAARGDRRQSALRRRDGAPARRRGHPAGRRREPESRSRRASGTSSPAGSTHLSEECNRVLVLASVLGREFALDGARSCRRRVRRMSCSRRSTRRWLARVVSDVPGAPVVFASRTS